MAPTPVRAAPLPACRAFLFLKSLVGGLHGCRASAGAGPCTAGAASRTRAAAHGTFEPPLGLSAADAELLSSVAIQVEPLAAALLL